MSENLWTIHEVTEYLHLSKQAIYTLAQNDLIPAFKLGTTWRFKRSDIDYWLISKANKTAIEIM
jgi:excisionase family DNA binding protein